MRLTQVAVGCSRAIAVYCLTDDRESAAYVTLEDLTDEARSIGRVMGMLRELMQDIRKRAAAAPQTPRRERSQGNSEP